MKIDDRLKAELPHLTIIRDGAYDPNAEAFFDFQYNGQEYTIAHRPILNVYGLWRSSQEDCIAFSNPDEVFRDIDLFIARINELWPEQHNG
jgi:hypothetical protein